MQTDQSKFMEEFNQVSRHLETYAVKLTKDRDDAKDLYQEVAERAFKNFDKYKSGTNFKAWTSRIMKNAFINNYRKKKKQSTLSDKTTNNYFINKNQHLEFNDGERTLLIGELENIIKDLQEDRREPFVMHCNGYQYDEIADMLSTPLGTIKSRIFFARRDIKQAILKLYDDAQSTHEMLELTL